MTHVPGNCHGSWKMVLAWSKNLDPSWGLSGIEIRRLTKTNLASDADLLGLKIRIMNSKSAVRIPAFSCKSFKFDLLRLPEVKTKWMSPTNLPNWRTPCSFNLTFSLLCFLPNQIIDRIKSVQSQPRTSWCWSDCCKSRGAKIKFPMEWVG